MINESQLLGKWINALLLDRFKEQKEEFTEKLFIKITGLTEENIKETLKGLTINMDQLSQYYKPVIRTITAMAGYEQYSFREHETSTWLRNNTQHNEALILIINEITPEAQSLDNLFTIDESYLLSEDSLHVLYEVLAIEANIVMDEVEIVIAFFEMCSKVFEPQLRNILNFLATIVNDDKSSMIDKIQTNLPTMNLFVDTHLIIKKSNARALKNNFELANLQNEAKSLDSEKLLNNLYQFLDEEEKNAYQSELWEKTNPDELREDVISFINQQNKKLLYYEFEIINSIFKFKKPIKLTDEIQDVFDDLEKLDEEQQKKVEIGIAEVAKQEDPDAIQDFYEEFAEILDKSPQVSKKIIRLIEKLRHPTDYDDFTYALLYESFSMIEDQSESEFISKATFRLEVKSSKVTPETYDLLKIYLNNLENAAPLIFFDKSSWPDQDSKVKTNDVIFYLYMNINGDDIEHRRFKLQSLGHTELLKISQGYKDGKIPYIKSFAESEVQDLDIREVLKKNVRDYITADEPGMEEHFEKFTSFLDRYQKHVLQAIEEGIMSLDVTVLESELDQLLSNIHVSVSVSKHIYHLLNFIGSIDSFEVQKGEVGIPNERILTVLNPIRMIAFIKRFELLNIQIADWLERATKAELEVEKIDEYLGYVLQKTKKLAPRYFTSGDDDSFLIEIEEVMGEGRFISSDKPTENTDYLAKELSQELIKVVKNYLEVYPYSIDGLDILFLHCQSAEVITQAIDKIFDNTNLRKLKITVHSEQAAKIHQKINKWVSQNEDYTSAGLYRTFPKLEINVISGRTVNEIENQYGKHMSDSDLVILLDYFGQSNQIKYKLEKADIETTNDWFEAVFKEPLHQDEAIKRINYVSEHLPTTLQSFYQLQYMVQTNAKLNHEEVYVLQNLISINNISHSSLIDFMHDHFNWVMILDRYLDKSLLQKASSKAQIIQYKSKAGSNRDFKLILSSSKYIRKLSEQTKDYAYYDRLTRKLISILKNENISRDIIVDAVQKVKEISGSIVLKVIGAGKYAHEMLATYLTTELRRDEEANFQVWAVCDELPWFSSNKRRPDLVLTSLQGREDKLKLCFELIELKFVNQNILEKERFDAVKQVKAGENLYQKLFKFDENNTDAEFWRDELIHYFIERGTYNPEQAKLLKKLQHINVADIEVDIKTSIDVYCYTSNLTNTALEKVDNGVYQEILEENIKNNIYNRSYILDKLGAKETIEPVYDEFEATDKIGIFEQYLENKNESSTDEQVVFEDSNLDNDSSSEDGVETAPLENESNSEIHDSKEPKDDDSANMGNHELTEEKPSLPEIGDKESLSVVVVNQKYPEVEALKDLDIRYEDVEDNSETLKDEYVQRLKRNFNQNGIHVNIKRSVIGSSVIRLYLSYSSSSLRVKTIKSLTEDMQVWLGLNEEPMVEIDNNGLYLDIVREKPATIYFEEFMALVREQQNELIKDTNLIAPLGLDPLKQVISVDLSESTTPHLLVGGTTGSGKSVTLNSIILGIMCLYSCENVQFVFIDPKQVEFNFYEGKTHTQKVITDIETAVVELENLTHEMDRRYSLMNKEYVSNLEEYIKITKEKLPRIIVVFDEFADFMSQDKDTAKRVETAVQRLGQKARAAGIHLIICTQNPKAEIINTKIRSNLPARLSLQVENAVASKIILDQDGAEKLAGKGDFLAKLGATPIRGKSPFLTTEVKRALLKYFEK